MTRLDLAFILCCCKACLVSNKKDEESFYDLLGVDMDATQDEIKRAYKRQSLQMHPDKLAQKGQVVTDELRESFTRMKNAYEVLADPHKRESYDTIGEVGMKWMDEPFSIDPQEMAHNFSTSSTVDRSKIFGIFVAVAIIIFITPILLCLQIDGIFGPDSRWVIILTPLWIYNALCFFYHTRVIMMGPVPRPDHIPVEEWIDPLPFHKRLFSLFRFLLLLVNEIFVALRLDNIIEWKWLFIFIPLFIYEIAYLCKRFSAARTEIITVEEVEYKFGKPFSDFTHSEKETFLLKSIVVTSKRSSEFANAEQLRSCAREDVIKLTFQVIFLVLLSIQLDTDADWSWWLVFAPFWFLMVFLCCFNFQNFKRTSEEVAEEDVNHDTSSTPHYGAMEEGGDEGDALPQKGPLSEAEKAVLHNRVSQSISRLMQSCCNSIFFVALLCAIVSKAQGAGFASMWIISPFLIFAGIILCVVGCAIFGVSPISENENIDPDDIENQVGVVSGNEGLVSYAPPINTPNQASSFERGVEDLSPAQIPLTTLSVEEIWADELETDNQLISSNTAPQKVTNEQENSKQINLLDDINLPLAPPNKEISRIEPTASEVDDLD